jgi:hypothetical protein
MACSVEGVGLVGRKSHEATRKETGEELSVLRQQVRWRQAQVLFNQVFSCCKERWRSVMGSHESRAFLRHSFGSQWMLSFRKIFEQNIERLSRLHAETAVTSN